MLRSLMVVPLLWVSMTATAGSIDPQVARHVDADVQAVLERTGTPGAAVAIIEDGHTVYSKAYGFGDREAHAPTDVGTYFEIGSITKQFTAAAILQLQEAGKLDIGKSLATYLPDAPHANEVTLRQLLSHTSGLPDYFDGPDVEAAATQPATFDQIMARIAAKPLDFPPGTRWSYSNTGYILLGRIIEVVSHRSYREYVQRELLDRAGMKQTFTVADEAHLPHMAVGYRRVDGKVERAPTINASFGWSAGFLVSTLADLQKWNDALTHGKIVTPADYGLMTTAVRATDGSDTEYGFGLFVDSFDDQPRIGHTGGSFGFTTANEYFPKQRVRIIAFTNLVDTPEPGERLTDAIFEVLYPDIAAAETRPGGGEDPVVTGKVRTTFLQIQGGTEDMPAFGARLGGKMQAGLAKRLAGEFAPYGAPTAFIFKGQRSDSGLKWFDYLIEFGPGSSLKFSIGFDDSGKIASLSFG